jgi:peptidylprolyl isomerase
MKFRILIAVVCALGLAAGASAQQGFDPWKGVVKQPEAKQKSEPKSKTTQAEPKANAGEKKSKNAGGDRLTLETTKGNIVIRLRTDLAPGHAARLKQLAAEGFYNNVPFHRVIDGFMAQTGDGQNGDGTGGSKYPDLKAEFSSTPFRRGIVGMARKGGNNNSANSQFFIMFAEQSSLNNQYTVIGEVVSGMDVVDKLNKGEPPRSPDRILRAVASQ